MKFHNMHDHPRWLMISLLLSVWLSGYAQKQDTASPVKDYLTVEEAITSFRCPESVAALAVYPDMKADFADFIPIQPVRVMDQLYFVGTHAVGAFIVDTKDGLVMLDTGCDDEDAAMMVSDMVKMGLDPSTIKLIFISHEHFDHYGGVQYLKKHVCPDAKVAMSIIGWNMLQTAPMEYPYMGKRPQSVDIYLTDGMKIKVGNITFQMVSTPGHSPGCMSFIFPVTDYGEPHMAGIMGGSAVFPTQTETFLYKASVEYFGAFAIAAQCDIGLYLHSQDTDFALIRARKPDERNPLILGTEKFKSVYLQSFRDRYHKMMKSGTLNSN